jgi:hypothetical protein
VLVQLHLLQVHPSQEAAAEAVELNHFLELLAQAVQVAAVRAQ